MESSEEHPLKDPLDSEPPENDVIHNLEECPKTEENVIFNLNQLAVEECPNPGLINADGVEPRMCVQVEGPNGPCFALLPPGCVYNEAEGVLYINPSDGEAEAGESQKCIQLLEVKGLEGLQCQFQLKNDDGEVSLSLVPDQLAEFAEIATANMTATSTHGPCTETDSKEEKTVSASEMPDEAKVTPSSSNTQQEGTVEKCEADSSEYSPERAEPTLKNLSQPVENVPQVVHSSFSSSPQLVDNAVSVIHKVTSFKEGMSVENIDSGEESLENHRNTQNDLDESVSKDSSTSHYLVHSKDENSTANDKLLNQEDKSVSLDSSINRTKDIDINENKNDINESHDVESNANETDMIENSSFPVERKPEVDGEESCNGTENCTETSECSEERMDDISNHSDNVSSQFSHVGNEAKDDPLSCSETDVDTKMDVDQDVTSIEDETNNSKISDKVRTVSEEVSENSCSLKVTSDHEASNGLQDIDTERNSSKNIPVVKCSKKTSSVSLSEDSGSQTEMGDELRVLRSKRKYKPKKSKSDAYEFDSGSEHSVSKVTGGHSETSLSKEDINTQTSNSILDSVQEKVDDSKLTFLGALDSTDTTLMNEDCMDCDDAADDHKSSDSFHTFGSADETKSLSFESPLASENPTNGHSCGAHSDNNSEDKASSDKELQGVTEASSMEETTVKVPKKTYLMKRRLNLLKVTENGQEKDKPPSSLNFMPESQTSELEDQNLPEEGKSVDEEHDIEDDFISNLKNRVSATYKRKRKSKAPIVQQIRTQSLRPRISHSFEALENGTTQAEEILNGIAQKEAEKDEESVYWGEYLSRTSFQTVKEDEPPLTKTRKKRVIFSSLNENNKLTWYKNRIKSGKQWDKLMKSSPYKVKKTGIEKRKLREKIKKQSLSLLNSKKFKIQLTKSLDNKKQGRSKKLNSVPVATPVSKVVKRCHIRYVCNSSEADSNTQTESNLYTKNAECFFNCLNCDFATDRPNIISRHFFLCCQTHSSKKIDYSVNDLAKQRIRGEHSKDEEEVKSLSVPNEISPDSDDDSCKAPSIMHTFKPKEVVWAELKKRFWPALLWELEDSNAFVYLITSKEGFKIPVNRLKSFNDGGRNKKYLEEAGNLPNLEDFVKAVQMSNSYARKQFVANNGINAKEFFKIPEDVKFLPDIDSNTSSTDSSSASSAIVEEILDSSPEKLDDSEFDMEALEMSVVDDVVDCILNGKCDDHVIAIFRKKIASERHKLHQQLLLKKNSEIASRLKDMSWFGPFKSDSTMQMRLYDYLSDLFKERVGNESKKSKAEMISYIYEVWIPEAIIKAISMVKDTTLDEAEIIFYKQETRSVNFGMEVDS